MRKFNVAVVGATGAVGEELFRVLEEYDFPINKLVPLASARSAGSKIEFAGKEHTVLELTETCFEENDVEIAFFSAGGSVSEKFAKFAVEAGAVVIDNTSHFRMDPKVPLVVPEVNPEDIKLWRETGIIANPNCSTIQMVQSLKPLDNLYGIKRVDVSTYQAVSGAGKKGMEELVMQMQAFFAFTLDDAEKNAFPYQIALNVIPQIDVAQPNGFTKEEMKMVKETQKIMHKDIQVWRETGIIANPNCSTIQMVQSLKPLDNLYGIKRVDVSTYQAVSGAGKKGMEELVMQMQAFFAFTLDDAEKNAFPYQIALNVIPQIDVAQPNGFTKEEMKMVKETQKIMHKDIQVAATCVRVPVLRSHSESITVTFNENVEVDLDEVRNALNNFENVKVIDDLENKKYPMPLIATDTDFTYVGRIKKDIYAPNIIHYFNVADQVRVGAATNAVRIGLKWIEMENDI